MASAATPVAPTKPFSSLDSSTDSFDSDPFPSPPIPADAPRLRLMCSSGGRIVPRPTTKSLCYVGGDTRIVAVDRRTNLADLKAKLSVALFAGRPFTLKYQLPDEDLDALVSVANDDDLDNMIDEYDRLAAGASSRLRLFLFPARMESSPTSTAGSLLDEDPKADSWFVDALNGAIGRVEIDGAVSVNSLGLDDEFAMPTAESNGKPARSGQESPVMTDNKTSSAPALSNFPPINLPPDDRPVIENRRFVQSFDELNFDSGFKEPQPPPYPPQLINSAKSNVSPHDEKSGGLSKAGHSANSVQVDSFMPDSGSRAVYSNANSDLKREPVVSSHAEFQNLMKFATDSCGYALPVMQDEQLKQQQGYIPVNPHYIHQQATGTMLPIPSYYQPITAHQFQQSQQIAPHYDPQFSMYYLPVRQNPAYNFTAAPTSTLNDHTLSKPDSPSPSLLYPYAGIGYHVLQNHQVAQGSAAVANYGYEYKTVDSIHPQVYYSKAISSSAIPGQLQTLSSGVVAADTVTAGNPKATRV